MDCVVRAIPDTHCFPGDGGDILNGCMWPQARDGTEMTILLVDLDPSKLLLHEEWNCSKQPDSRVEPPSIESLASSGFGLRA
jgi:hypothetical protein